MNQKLTVGIADMKIGKGNDLLVTYALGSCIGLCFYDQRTKTGALLHIMLPLNMEPGRKNPLKYADTGIRETLRQLETQGASRSRITVKIAGGAKMFETAQGSALGNIGKRNADSVHMILRAEKIPLLAEDLGGTTARTISFDPGTGKVTVRSYGKADYVI